MTGTGADNSTLAFGSDKSRGGRALGLGLGAAVWNDSARAQVWSCLSVPALRTLAVHPGCMTDCTPS